MIKSFFLTTWFGRFFSQPSEKYSECFLVDGLISGFLGILSLLLFVLGVASSNQRPGIRSTKNPFLCPDHVSIFANLNEQNFFSVWENLAKSDDLARKRVSMTEFIGQSETMWPRENFEKQPHSYMSEGFDFHFLDLMKNSWEICKKTAIKYSVNIQLLKIWLHVI